MQQAVLQGVHQRDTTWLRKAANSKCFCKHLIHRVIPIRQRVRSKQKMERKLSARAAFHHASTDLKALEVICASETQAEIKTPTADERGGDPQPCSRKGHCCCGGEHGTCAAAAGTARGQAPAKRASKRLSPGSGSKTTLPFATSSAFGSARCLFRGQAHFCGCRLQTTRSERVGGVRPAGARVGLGGAEARSRADGH